MYYVVTGTLRPLEPLGCLHRFSHELKVPLPVITMLQSFAIYCFKRSIITGELQQIDHVRNTGVK